MTNKEELREQLKTKFSALELIYRDTEKTTLLDLLVDFFWNEIEQIRKADMEKVVEEIEKLDYRDFEKGNQFVTKEEVLSIIKQD